MTAELVNPRSLGPYLLGRKLGAGGMATVFAARQVSTHVKRLVALKVLSSQVSHQDPEHRSFMREAMLATRLEHPNVVRTYDVGEVDGSLYIAMELIHGASLSAIQKASPVPQPLRVVVRIGLDVARGLHVAHELADPESGPLGVVHQDVSPQNVLIAYDGTIKLVDFGVARFAAIEGSRTETLRGKAAYASPEQLAGKNIDRRTDVFALGIVLWELVAGQRLFRKETNAATYIAILQGPIPHLSEIDPKVPRAIADVVATALERRVDRRYATTEELAFALAGAAAQSGVGEAHQQEVAQWVASLVPADVSPVDMEREIVSISPSISPSSAPSARKPSSPHFGAVSEPRPKPMPADIPDLDLPGPPSAARPSGPKPTPSRPNVPVAAQPPAPIPAGSAVPELGAPVRRASGTNIAVPQLPASGPVSVRPTSSAGPRSVQPPPSASLHPAPHAHHDARAIEVGMPDDDDDMEIEREGALHAVAASKPAHSSRGKLETPMRQAPTATTGLDVGYNRAQTFERPQRRAAAATPLTVAIGYVVSGAVFFGTIAGLSRVFHRPGGIVLTNLLPHAFDATSTVQSGGVALSLLAVAVGLGFGGLKMVPRSWVILGAAFATLATSLAMVTVTLVSTEENPMPPDGARLVPYTLPLALLLVGVGIAGRAARLFRRESVAKKIAVVPITAIAAAFAFAALEVSGGVLFRP